MPGLELIKKDSVPVLAIDGDVVLVEKNPMIKVGDLVVFVRLYEDNVEIISQGSVGNIQDGRFIILIDGASIVKIPTTKDRVISLARLTPKAPEEPPPETTSSFPDPEPEAYEPGFIQLDFGPMLGSFNSSGDTRANQYKIFQFTYVDFRLEWYLDFLWRYGIQYESFGAKIPLKSYKRDLANTKYSESRMALMYRFLPLWKELRPSVRLISLSGNFTTENDDEAVLSSQVSGLGLGGRFVYQFGDNLFSSRRQFESSFNRLYLDLNIFPGITVKDGDVARGQTGSSMVTEIEVGGTYLLYIEMMPWVKRYSIDFSFGLRQDKISFSGDSISAPDGFYEIPSGKSYTENQSYIKLMFGVRMDDFITKFLRPR